MKSYNWKEKHDTNIDKRLAEQSHILPWSTSNLEIPNKKSDSIDRRSLQSRQ